MPGLTAEEKAELKSIMELQLIDLRQQAQDAMQNVKQAETSLIEEGDVASRNASQAVASKLLSRSNGQIKSIFKALQCLKEDDYGLCERCGDDVGFQRLQVCPTAVYCISCQEVEERSRKLHRQPPSDNPFLPD
jgi:DnaK suppressor protein